MFGATYSTRATVCFLLLTYSGFFGVQAYQIIHQRNVSVEPGNFYVFNQNFKTGSGRIDFLRAVSVAIKIQPLNSLDSAQFDLLLLDEKQFECYNQVYQDTTSLVDRCDLGYLNSNNTYLYYNKTEVLFELYPNKTSSTMNPDQQYYIVIDNTRYPGFIYEGQVFFGAFHNLNLNLIIQTTSNIDLSYYYYDITIALVVGIVLLALSFGIFVVVFHFKYRQIQKRTRKLKQMKMAGDDDTTRLDSVNDSKYGPNSSLFKQNSSIMKTASAKSKPILKNSSSRSFAI